MLVTRLDAFEFIFGGVQHARIGDTCPDRQFWILAPSCTPSRCPNSLVSCSLTVIYFITKIYLVEVEKAAEVIRTIGKGRKIVHVDALEDTIVYSGVTNTEFVSITLVINHVSHILTPKSRPKKLLDEHCWTLVSQHVYWYKLAHAIRKDDTGNFFISLSMVKDECQSYI